MRWRFEHPKLDCDACRRAHTENGEPSPCDRCPDREPHADPLTLEIWRLYALHEKFGWPFVHDLMDLRLTPNEAELLIEGFELIGSFYAELRRQGARG